MIVEELVAKLGFQFDDSGFKEFRESVSDAMSKFTQFESVATLAIAGAVAAVAAGLAGLTGHVAHEVTEMSELSEQVGIATEKLQALGAVALQSGTNQQTLINGLRLLSGHIDDASKGGEQAQKVFGRLGLSMAAITNSDGTAKSAGEVFDLVAGKLSKMTNEVTRTHLAQELLGRSGTRLIPLMNKLAAGDIDDFIAKGKELGYVLGEEDVEAFTKLEHSMQFVGLRMQGISNIIATSFRPYMQQLVDLVDKALDAFVKRFKPALEETARVIGSGLVGALKVATEAIKGAISLMEQMGFSMNEIAAIAIAVGGILFAAFFPVTATVLAITAALFLLFDDINVYMKGGHSAIGELVKGFQKLKDEIENVWKNSTLGKWVDESIQKIEQLIAKLRSMDKNEKGESITGNAVKSTSEFLSPSKFVGDWGRILNNTAPNLIAQSQQAAAAQQAPAQQTINVTVNPSQGMDEKGLADMVIEKIQDAGQAMIDDLYSALVPLTATGQ